MKNKSTIQRQLLAACLLAVFLLITAGKLFHTHGAAGPIADASYTGQVAKNSDCPVCDYHFTKDAGHLSDAFAPATPFAFSSRTIAYESRTVSSIGLSYSDRGPPALI